MNQLSVLKKVEENQMTPFEALQKLYPVTKTKPGKRAFFIKISIKIPEEGKGINRFLKLLFAIPIPMMFARMGFRLATRFVKSDEVDFKELSKLIKYSRNTAIQVESKDAIINIKVM